MLKVADDDSSSSRSDAKLGTADNNAETTIDKSATEHDRSPTPMQSSESLVPAEGSGDTKSPSAGVRDACEPPAVKAADRHIADMATLTVDDMVRYWHFCCY